MSFERDETVYAPEACSPNDIVVNGDVSADITDGDITAIVDGIVEGVCACLDGLEFPEPVTPPTVVVSPCQPCFQIDGQIDHTAFYYLVDGVPQVANINGPVTDWVIVDCCADEDEEKDCCECDPADMPLIAENLANFIGQQ